MIAVVCVLFCWPGVLLVLALRACTLLFETIDLVSDLKDINLVDPASSHTLVSKIKPCMSKYKQLCTVKLRMAHYISYSLLDSTLLLG